MQQPDNNKVMTGTEASVPAPREGDGNNNNNNSPGGGRTIEEKLARIAAKKAKRHKKILAKSKAIRKERESLPVLSPAEAERLYYAEMVKRKGVVVTGPGFTAIKTNSKADTASLAKGAVEASDRRPDPMPVDDPIDHSVDETDEYETQPWSAATRVSEHKYVRAEIERRRAEALPGVDFSERGALQETRREQAKACKDVVDDWEAWVDEEYGPQRP